VSRLLRRGRHGQAGRGKGSTVFRVAAAVPLAVASLGLGGWMVTNSSIFAAHRIQVAGAVHLTRAEILRVAGVGHSTNVLWANPSAIEASLQADPWIERAAVTRDLPSTLRIEVTERSAASTVLVGSTWFLVATDGTVLGPAHRRPHLPGLPNSASLTVGGRSGALAIPAEVAARMPPWLRARVATVSSASDGTMQLGLDNGVRVLFGPPTDVAAKNEALAGILRWAARRGTHLATIDVRSPIAPAATPFGWTPPAIAAPQPGFGAPGTVGGRPVYAGPPDVPGMR
jgi:cell division protein FtsQ